MRKRLVHWLFDQTQKIYTRWLKRNHIPWNISTATLLHYPKESFGYHLGQFLNKNNFELIAKVERHDAYHTLCGYGTNVEDEIALQYLCLGNGKRSPYMFGAIILGTIILPDYFRYYYRSFTIGRNANTFHHFDFKEVLPLNFEDFRQAIFSRDYINSIAILSIPKK